MGRSSTFVLARFYTCGAAANKVSARRTPPRLTRPCEGPICPALAQVSPNHRSAGAGIRRRGVRDAGRPEGAGARAAERDRRAGTLHRAAEARGRPAERKPWNQGRLTWLVAATARGGGDARGSARAGHQAREAGPRARAGEGE